MTAIQRWWGGLTEGEKVAMGVLGGLAILATGGALAYAIASGGVIVASEETVVFIGAATSRWGLTA